MGHRISVHFPQQGAMPVHNASISRRTGSRASPACALTHLHSGPWAVDHPSTPMRCPMAASERPRPRTASPLPTTAVVTGRKPAGSRVAMLVSALLLAFSCIAATSPARADAAVALRGAAVTTTDNSGTVTAKTFATPSSALAGDLLVATLAYRTPTTADIANTAPTGWTKIPGETFDPGATTAGAHLVVAVKRAVGGAEAPVWRFASSPRGVVVTVHAYSGASTSVDVANRVYPFEKWGYAPDSGSGTSTHAAPTFTPSVSGSWGFAAFAARSSEV